METLLVVIFVIGYLAITLEHNLKIDKLIPALAMMAILWAMMAFGLDGFTTWFDSANHALLENFSSSAMKKRPIFWKKPCCTIWERPRKSWSSFWER